jgi:uncharacterized protein YdhG (YjbR/CyaY superfamily)
VTPKGIDEYLATLDEQKRTALQELRQTILEIIPNAEECISYRIPAFRLEGKVIAGFAAFKYHLSYLPHSGSVFRELSDDLSGYESTPYTRLALSMVWYDRAVRALFQPYREMAQAVAARPQ